MSASLPLGLVLPQSTSAAAQPLSMPPCQSSSRAESLSPYYSVQARSMTLPVYKSTTVLEKAAVTASSMSRSSSVR